jgi:opacity protein-like surface antigen
MKRVIGLVALIALVAIVGNAQQIGLKSIGGEVGYNSFSFASESWGGIMFGAVANLGEVTPGLSLYPSVTYATASKSLYGADAKVNDFAINANVKYAFKGQGITPYVGGGIGLNFVSTTVALPSYFGYGGGTATASDTKIGMLGGAEMAFGKMTGFAQAGYNIVSDVSHFQVLVGVMFPMN